MYLNPPAGLFVAAAGAEGITSPEPNCLFKLLRIPNTDSISKLVVLIASIQRLTSALESISLAVMPVAFLMLCNNIGDADLISLRNRGLITSDVANKAAKVICRQSLEDAAKAETAFERYYDI